ncbi:hypothetical protein [Rhizobium leguminosarum]|uniref:hypothetical protein n=1 Tax=Rhizobium leguminosarum TaxID=384 RepID=UPI0024A8DB13|nr:hypothetical protein [Rhizobium leguminosarum]MDI5929422.1 hypothetical protein [Rhizobium leguminosarum]
MAIDDDVEYMTLVELWVEGEIDIHEMRQRYNEILARRSADRMARRGNSPSQGLKPAPVSQETADASIAMPSINEDKTTGICDADGPPRDETSPTG